MNAGSSWPAPWRIVGVDFAPGLEQGILKPLRLAHSALKGALQPDNHATATELRFEHYQILKNEDQSLMGLRALVCNG
jgi:hypothetical protein